MLTDFALLAAWTAPALYLLPVVLMLAGALAPQTRGRAVFSRVAASIDALNAAVGSAARWLALAIVLVQFGFVLLRYVFGLGTIFVQEAVMYMFAALFLLAAGYALLRGAHVRVDMLYRGWSEAAQARADLAGAIILLLPFTLVVLSVSAPYVEASWAVREGSKETSGIQGVFLLKTLIPAMALLVLLQGWSLAIRAALVLSGHREAERA